jgi:uncharacterized protein with PIN domain
MALMVIDTSAVVAILFDEAGVPCGRLFTSEMQSGAWEAVLF